MKKITSVIILLSMAILLLSGCVVENVASVGKINGHEILLGEYSFYLQIAQSAALQRMTEEDMQKDNIWEDVEIEGKKAGQWVKDYAFENLIEIKIANLRAEDEGYTLTEEDKEQIENAKQYYIQVVGGPEAFSSNIASLNLTEASFDKVWVDYYKALMYQDKVKNSDTIKIDESQIDVIYKNEYISAKHILRLTNSLGLEENEDGEEQISQEELEGQVLEEVENILSQVNSGVPFEDLIAQYNEDPGQTEEGYVFAEGKMVSEFYEGALELSVGEVSKPIKTDYGYHIIKRYELPYEGTQYENAVREITEKLKTEEYEKIIKEWEKEYTIEKNEKEINKIKL